jgi:hypothetical protein
MMHVYSICRTAEHASMAIPLPRLPSFLFPFPNIWSGCAASPEMAAFGRVRSRPLRAHACRRSAGPLIRAEGYYETGVANRTMACLFSASAPPDGVIAGLGTKRARSMAEICRRPIEARSTTPAFPFLAVFLPIEGGARYSLVPRRSVNVGFPAFWRTPDTVRRRSRDRGVAAFARMRFGFHAPTITRYAAMARRRIEDDGPLFADVAD